MKPTNHSSSNEHVAAGILPAVEGGILPPGPSARFSGWPGEGGSCSAGQDACRYGRAVRLSLCTVVAALLAAVAGTAAAQTLLRGPYLQLATPGSIVVRWRTDIATDTQVAFGTSLAALSRTNTSADAVTEHVIQLAGLNPSTRYYYSVGSSTNVLSPAATAQFFITPPPPGTPKPTRIWIIGDAGTADTNQLAVRDAYLALTGTNYTDFWLQLGDNAYSNGTDSDYQYAVFNMYTNLLPQSVTWPTLGNHDTAQSTVYTNTYPYFSIFTLPTAGEAGGVPSGTPHYYSFDYANIHLICLDSMTADRSPTGAMALWLTADLQANTNQWVIAYWHHPPYSAGSHQSDYDQGETDMRMNLVPILEAYGVDMVFCGHSHSYERSFLINGHLYQSWTFTTNMIVQPGTGREEETGAYVKPRGYSIGRQGAVYTVAGSAGQTSGGPLNYPAMCVSSNVLGSVLLQFNGNRLDEFFLRETGATNDHFTILKANFPPVASNLNFTVNANVATPLALAGSDINRDPIQFAQGNPPAHGLISAFNPLSGAFTYTPAHGFAAADAFTFTVNDGQTSSAPATVSIAVTPPSDTNGNGLPDAWEAQYGVSDPNGDPDHDGMTNLQEYWAGTNPLDSNSCLRVTAILPAGAGFTLTWKSVGGVRYRILYSDGNATGAYNGVFTPLVRSAAAEMDPSALGAASTRTFTDDYSLTGPPAHGRRYYRVQVVQ
jgi:hypothetical protein